MHLCLAPLLVVRKKIHSSGAASPVQQTEAANIPLCWLSSWLRPWAYSWALGLPGCPPSRVWGAGTLGSRMMGAARPPGSPREACGDLEAAVLLASGPLPPNMVRQNGGFVGGGAGGERSYLRVPCQARTTTPRMLWVESGRDRGLASLGCVSPCSQSKTPWKALLAPGRSPAPPRNWLTGIVVHRQQS